MPEDILASILERAVVERPGANPEQLADLIIQELGQQEWSVITDRIGRAWLAARVRQRIKKLPDPRQGFLDLPGFQHVPAAIREDTLEKYREATAKLQARIRSYSYARVSEETRKQDAAELRERLKLDKKTAAYFANNPEMTMGKAIEMLRVSLESPRAVHNRSIASKGGIAKNR